MKRVLIVYNPRSSRFADMKTEVLGRLRELKGCIIGKYEVEKTGVDRNVVKFAGIVRDGDIVLAVGGDATAVIAANGILRSGKDAKLAVLPYGNFNDLSRTLGIKDFDDLLSRNNRIRKLYPLEILVDGKLLRYATCYVTVGMTAEATRLFDQPKVRKNLRKRTGRSLGSYVNLANWYFRNRHKKKFIPQFKVNGVVQDEKISDYIAVNGRRMARVMRGGEDCFAPKVFRSGTDKLANFFCLVKMMTKSILVRIPGTETKGDRLEFLVPATVEIQAEGELCVLRNAREIEIRKANKWLKVIGK